MLRSFLAEIILMHREIRFNPQKICKMAHRYWCYVVVAYMVRDRALILGRILSAPPVVLPVVDMLRIAPGYAQGVFGAQTQPVQVRVAFYMPAEAFLLSLSAIIG